MYSYDLQITSGTDWQAVANLGVSSVLQIVHNTAGLEDVPLLRVRFGAASSSNGFNVSSRDVLLFDKTLYVKPLGVVGVNRYTVNVTVYE